MKINFKQGDVVRLTTSCKSGMLAGTIGILVENCGFHRGRTLHFHAALPGTASYLHAKGLVCRNSDRWELVHKDKEKRSFRKGFYMKTLIGLTLPIWLIPAAIIGFAHLVGEAVFEVWDL